MDPVHRDTLQKKHGLLVVRLQPDLILDHLQLDGIFEEQDCDNVRSSRTEQEQSQKLLDKLLLCGPRAYPCFLKALKAEHAKDLVKELDKQEAYPL